MRPRAWSNVPAEVRLFDDAGELGVALAGEVVAAYGATDDAFLLGCPGGRSLRTTYRALATRLADPARLLIVMMDEYVAAPEHAHYSCRRFAREEIAGPLGIPDERVLIPDAADPETFERAIAEHGGIAVFLLASGASDGHVAFLPPGSPRDGRTAVIELAETTRRDNLVTFPDFESLEDVPRQGVSVGLGTIADARALRLVLHGADKREATRRLLALRAFDSKWPASIVHDHPDAEIWVDRAAFAS